MNLETAVHSVHDFDSLIGFLVNELKWDIERGPLEDLTFEWTTGDLKVSESSARRLKDGSVFQLRPPPSVLKQPWGIFFVRFANNKIYRGVLRQVLRALVPKQRRESHLPAWKHENLLFICTTSDYEEFSFSHFSGLKAERAVLSTFGWKRGDTHVRTLSEFNLPALSWPQDENDTAGWLKKWSAAFDVERVTDRFFVSYRDVFEEVEGEVKKSISNREQARLYTQRLFNRLMFIYFIQKKGWLSFNGDKNYLRSLFSEAEKNKERFLQDRLYWLFFYGMGNAGSIRNPQLQQFLETRRGLVPFLNGGLFEIEDDYDAKLSTEKKFEAADVAVSNKALGRILELFERYNFTIEESTPLEVQVAVDPEMLGKVFEELVTGRHETGSYYTPRPVVAFMCREALKHYLSKSESNAEAISLFVDEGNTSQLGDPETLLDALKRVRVCDPACGSGAYLLGMQQELMRLRGALFKDYKIDFDKLYDRKREIIEKNLYGVDKDRFAVQIACLRLWLSLAIESEHPKPLPNLDFKIGCDDSLTAPPPQETQPDMFREEKVRAFQKKKAEFLQSADPDKKRKLREEIEILRDEIAVALQHQPPKPNPQRVKLAKEREQELSKEVKRLIRENKKPEAAIKQAQLKKLQKQIDLWEKTAKGNGINVGFDWAVEFAEIFMPQVGEKWRMDDLHPLVNDFKLNPTLIEQPTVQDGGFDIVLANPPYVRADAQFKHIPKEKDRLASIAEWKVYRAALLKTRYYNTLFEKWDLYMPFLERAYQLLREGGDMVFIISDAYNAAKYAIRSHAFFLKESSVKRVDFCSDIPLFKAGVSNTILHFSKEPPDNQVTVRVRRSGEAADDFDRNLEILPTGFQSELGARVFKIDSTEVREFESDVISLSSLCYISKGMVLHSEDTKMRFTKDDLISEKQDEMHPKAFMEGKYMEKWIVRRVLYLEYGTDRSPDLCSRKTFPELYEVPEKLISMDISGLEQRVAYDNRQLFHNHSAWSFVPWHFLRGVRNKSIKKTAKYEDEFRRGESRPLLFRSSLEDVSKDFEPKYLLAIMNSSFAKHWISTKRRSKIHVYPDDWKLLPIPRVGLKDQQVVVELVNRILFEFEENGYPLPLPAAHRVTELERQIDERVDALYSAPTVSNDEAAKPSFDKDPPFK